MREYSIRPGLDLSYRSHNPTLQSIRALTPIDESSGDTLHYQNNHRVSVFIARISDPTTTDLPQNTPQSSENPTVRKKILRWLGSRVRGVLGVYSHRGWAECVAVCTGIQERCVWVRSRVIVSWIFRPARPMTHQCCPPKSAQQSQSPPQRFSFFLTSQPTGRD